MKGVIYKVLLFKNKQTNKPILLGVHQYCQYTLPLAKNNKSAFYIKILKMEATVCQKGESDISEKVKRALAELR